LIAYSFTSASDEDGQCRSGAVTDPFVDTDLGLTIAIRNRFRST